MVAHPKIEILRAKLSAYTALSALRYDTLTDEQCDRLEALIDLHGDQRLVNTANSTCRTPPPLYVTAFLGTWESLPAPGKTLEVVEPLCGVCSLPESRCHASNRKLSTADRHEFEATA